ncbi:G2/mitotic-specific cyclin-B [Cytospora mali]|uniref:G2/mitotic-specific cyclin-B n=1 Tax=Cytospora mali TaxID=578113 RepID=A0A194VNJ6_CYTMA|nr:G2/mitotic-specific cyclin-B [Valsa mali]
MPTVRTTRARVVAAENDENNVSNNSTRLTRAKAAALNVDELSQPSKPLQSKKSAVNANVGGVTKKRAALGDIGNITKVEAAEGKKAIATKTGLSSKTTQANRVQKPAAAANTTTRRGPLASKENILAKKPTKISGPGSIASKRKARPAAPAPAPVPVKEEKIPVEADEPVRKKVHTVEKDKENQKRSKEVIEDVKPAPEPTPEPALVPESHEEEPESIYPPGVENLDAEDFDDPLMVAEYAHEIFDYLLTIEPSSLPNPDYMDHQDELEWKTRSILVDWLIEVHTRFHLLPETLFLAINIIDRFLSEKVVQLDRVQLVGITAMFIASKYEEVLSPHVGNFKHVADNGFSESEILSAERFILQTLQYDLSYPNPMNFLRRISKADNYDIQTRTVAKYLLEISVVDHRFMSYRPSHIAATAMYLARLILDRGDWDLTLSFYAGYTEEEIEPVLHLMVDYLARPVVHEAFFKKYASKKFLKASILTRQWAKKNAVAFEIHDLDRPIDE